MGHLSKDHNKISQSNCDLVFGYFNQNTPDEIINICVLFAFKLLFDSSILTSIESADLHQMVKHISSDWKLLYRGSRDGYKVNDCHPICHSQRNVVLLIETKKGNIFGGYTRTGWSLNARAHQYKQD